LKTQEAVVSEIDIKEAVRRAKEFATTLFESEKILKLGLEAVEKSEDGRYWLVTLGFTRPHLFSVPKKTRSLSALDELLPRPEAQPKREYKVFRVDMQSGEVIGVSLFEE
jgi:hypothetical protein